jgi:hypothetical protein
MRKLPFNNESSQTERRETLENDRRVKERRMMRQLDPYNLGIYNK